MSLIIIDFFGVFVYLIKKRGDIVRWPSSPSLPMYYIVCKFKFLNFKILFVTSLIYFINNN